MKAKIVAEGKEFDISEILSEQMEKNRISAHDRDELVQILRDINHLLITHWQRIKNVINDQELPAGTISLSVALDHSGIKRKVITKIGYSQKYKDEVEAWVDDPNQTKLNFDKEEE